jgi:hypothetical protein
LSGCILAGIWFLSSSSLFFFLEKGGPEGAMVVKDGVRNKEV